MFEELVNSYKALPIDEKRNKLLLEMKTLVAVFDNICDEQNIPHEEIKSKEILDLNNGLESESDYLESLFVYLEYLKEVVSAAYIGKE